MFPKESQATRSSRKRLSHPWLPKQYRRALESRKYRGRLCSEGLMTEGCFGRVGKARVPLVEVVGQVGVQDPRCGPRAGGVAPPGLQRSCWFLTIGLAIAWLAADSAIELKMGPWYRAEPPACQPVSWRR